MSDTNMENIDILENSVEEPEREAIIYNVILDENNYYTGMACIANYSRFTDGIDVESLPPDTDDTIMKKSYKLADGIWEFDEARYNELIAEEEEKKVAPVQQTQEERITALEEQNEMFIECLLEMSELMYV